MNRNFNEVGQVASEMGVRIGLPAKDVARFSIAKAIADCADGKLSGFEKEVSDEVARKSGLPTPQFGFSVPAEVLEHRCIPGFEIIRNMRRGLEVTDATKGGFTVATNIDGANMIELLRNKSAVVSLGARVLTGLQGNLGIPKHSGGATAYWLTEDASVTATTQAFKQMVLTPHRLAGHTIFSRQLLRQASIDIENFVRSDITETIATERDRAAIDGLGAAGEPLGILNTTGINTVTFGAAATFAKLVDFEKEVESDNALAGRLGWLTTPVVKAKWKTKEKVANTAQFLWENGEKVLGYPAVATKQVPSDKVIFGNWNDLIIAEWGSLDIVVDPYSNAKTNQIAITIQINTDIGIRHPESFCASTDSGAQ